MYQRRIRLSDRFSYLCMTMVTSRTPHALTGYNMDMHKNPYGKVKKLLNVFLLVEKTRTSSDTEEDMLNEAMSTLSAAIKNVDKDNGDVFVKINALFFSNDPELHGSLETALRDLNMNIPASGALLGLSAESCLPIIVIITSSSNQDGYYHELNNLKSNDWFKNAIKLVYCIGDKVPNKFIYHLTRHGDFTLLEEITKFEDLVRSKTRYFATNAEVDYASLLGGVVNYLTGETDPCHTIIAPDIPDLSNCMTYEPEYTKHSSMDASLLRNLENLEHLKHFESTDALQHIRETYDNPPPPFRGFLGIGCRQRIDDLHEAIAEHVKYVKELDCEIARAKALVQAETVYSSVFAPLEVKRRSNMMVQIYLHKPEEADIVCNLAYESQKNAERRGYTPLCLKLNKGDKVKIEFSLYGEDLLLSESKSLIWSGSFTKCAFRYFVHENINVHELYCEATMEVNGAMIGEICFTTQIVESPVNLKTEIVSHKFEKIFVSYAHADAKIAEALVLAYKSQGMEVFYDKHSLFAGDIFEELIFERIDSSDVFVLCWSQNAAKSEYVIKEKNRALLHAYPQQSLKDATLKILPFSITPKAELPEDMINIYHFASIE